MRITLIFLAILLGISLTWLVRQSVNVRPWVAEAPGPGMQDRLPARVAAARLGLVVFLAVVTSLFMLSTSAYFMRMELGRDWIPLSVPPLLWVNTVILVAASLALQRAWNAARRLELDKVRAPLVAGAACTVVFVLGQAVAWWQLHSGGQHLGINPATSFFYFMTALHALHLLGGLAAWVRTLRRLGRGDSPQRIRVSVELCTVYWHFLLVLWLGILGLLITT